MIRRLVLLLALTPTAGQAQNLSADFRRLLHRLPEKPVSSMKYDGERSAVQGDSATSEFRMTMLVLINGYQRWISAQDLSVCNFNPSCSRFSALAVRKGGFVRGLLLTGDRLLRCHGLPGMHRHYPSMTHSPPFPDPIEEYLKP